jgi:hypothetical protein
MEPFPFADLFTHGWALTDLTAEGGDYFVLCLGCDARVEVRGEPRALPEISHEEPCPVADYIANPEGGKEGRIRVHSIARASERPPEGSPS